MWLLKRSRINSDKNHRLWYLLFMIAFTSRSSEILLQRELFLQRAAIVGFCFLSYSKQPKASSSWGEGGFYSCTVEVDNKRCHS
jgi:hypothetical protein